MAKGSHMTNDEQIRLRTSARQDGFTQGMKAGLKEGYLKALADLYERLDNAVSNGGGLDAGNGKFIENAHWDFEIRDLINELRDSA